ncbi:MAG: HdeA/HdeB family chaperone [Cyanobacteria bacterium J06634_6]
MKKLGWFILSATVATLGITTFVSSQTSAQEESMPEEGAPAVTETADAVDLATLTCRDFLKTPGDEQANLMIFMHGYMSGVAGSTTIDGPALANASDSIVDGCIDDPEGTLFSQFEANR